ncbi:MAG TPA: cupin domain-containing protein [Nakamurella sp.]
MDVQPKAPSTKGPSAMFTGDVWFDVIATGVLPSRLRVNLVRFAPGAHTAWHRHANGQTLHVTDGIGLVQARGGEVIAMKPGDTVYTPPGEWHWHGAAPENFMAHLAMWESLAEGQEGPETEWAEHLSRCEYPGESSSGYRGERNS